jgi:hypothetical protein
VIAKLRARAVSTSSGDDLRVVDRGGKRLHDRERPIELPGVGDPLGDAAEPGLERVDRLVRGGAQGRHHAAVAGRGAEGRTADRGVDDGRLCGLVEAGEELAGAGPGGDDLRHRQGRAAAPLRLRRVGGGAGELDRQAARGAGEDPRAEHHPPELVAGKIVRRQRDVGAQPGEGRIGDHGRRPLAGFLGGLEEDHEAAALRLPAGERPRHSDGDGHVAVVPALVGDPAGPGGVVRHRRVLDRQRVRVGAQQHGRAVLASVEGRRHAVPSNALDEQIGREGLQLADEARRRLHLAAGRLGGPVQLAAQLGQVALLQAIHGARPGLRSDPPRRWRRPPAGGSCILGAHNPAP